MQSAQRRERTRRQDTYFQKLLMTPSNSSISFQNKEVINISLIENELITDDDLLLPTENITLSL